MTSSIIGAEISICLNGIHTSRFYHNSPVWGHIKCLFINQDIKNINYPSYVIYNLIMNKNHNHGIYKIYKTYENLQNIYKSQNLQQNTKCSTLQNLKELS